MRDDGITEESLKALVEVFYAKVRRDPLIGPVFNHAIDDWAEHLDKLQAFWSSMMLTSGRYKGRPLPAHVKHADSISPASFERWLALWGETTDEMLDADGAAACRIRPGGSRKACPWGSPSTATATPFFAMRAPERDA